MPPSDDFEAFRFVEATTPGPLIKPRPTKERSAAVRNLTPILVFSALGAIVLGTMKREEILRYFDPPPAPKSVPKPRPPVIGGSEAPPFVRWAPRPQPQPVSVAPVPVVQQPEASAVASLPVAAERPTPETVLAGKGLVLVGIQYLLTDKEDAISRAFKSYGASYNKASVAGDLLFEVETRHAFIATANRIKAGLHHESENLNIAMAGVPRICGPRERSLNSSQIWMHYQELQNRGNINDLNLAIENARFDLSQLPPRDRANGAFNDAYAASRRSHAEVESLVGTIEQEYESLRSDPWVKWALAEDTRIRGGSRTLGPSAELGGRMQTVRNHAGYYR